MLFAFLTCEPTLNASIQQRVNNLTLLLAKPDIHSATLNNDFQGSLEAKFNVVPVMQLSRNPGVCFALLTCANS
ncbi:hypothetical protein GCM10009347_30120 [Shewanella algicola]|uniref:Uncharacterized protein n=1 Tax=Shewanella algicola TaxID=640633 RepID=A0A9X1ZDQ6_9GAMM|nr:hypothetical protein [Shewanella algicola]MCL1106745.1 hypothetical protein [Shewanella algicola]GGP61978.1 hypothetical protein GCM10009347_30120 [Shewanella algicola]